MIGVIANSHPAWVVEEFFQLFKTPWEMWRPDRAYDVVIAVGTEVAGDAAPLVIVMGSQSLAMDLRQGAGLQALATGSVLRDGEDTLPLYGEVAALPAQPGAERLGVVEGSAVVLRSRRGGHTFIRLGYDLFEEARHILTGGQPVEHAAVPTLDLHVDRLRRWMNDAGLTFVEIAPVPYGYPFIVSLTHDIDFIGIRRHFGDHTMLGFLYRATLGSGRDFLRGRLSFGRLCRNWVAAATLPFVYLGLARDFWVPFPWLLEVEAGLAATYYLIPFKGRPGAKVKSAHPERRATGYDVTDMTEWTRELARVGCEIGVHGIDAWHDPAAGRAERERVAGVSGTPATGIRMHWLEFDENSYRVLEEAGYGYDTTMGYNETVGYRHGTAQVFRPPGAAQLLELPMHIQDGALFYPSRLGLSEPEAHKRCSVLLRQAERTGGVLTVLWHDRSHAPDRNWGEFYRELIARLQQRGVWFATAGQVVDWFRHRRATRFVEQAGQMRIESIASTGLLPFLVRVHRPEGVSDRPWTGAEACLVAMPLAVAAESCAA